MRGVSNLARKWMPVLMACGLVGAPDSIRAQKNTSEKVDLDTEDGVYLTAEFWPAPKPSRQAAVVMLLHQIGKTRRAFVPLADQLQKEGYAVVAFDFRGHGDSRRINPEVYDAANGTIAPSGGGDEIHYATAFRRGKDYESLMGDITAVKNFLLTKNNAERLNIKQLGVIGAGPVSCNLALRFAREEFVGGGKPGFIQRGDDLHALVLISPVRNYKGLQAVTSFGKGGDKLPIMIVSSDAPKSESEASRLARTLHVPESVDEKKSKRRVAKSNDREASVWMKFPGVESGMDLLKPDSDVTDQVLAYLQYRLEPERTREWSTRKIGRPGTFGAGRKSD